MDRDSSVLSFEYSGGLVGTREDEAWFSVVSRPRREQQHPQLVIQGIGEIEEKR